MMPQMTPDAPPAAATDPAAAITKHVNAIVQSLALLYKECHQAAGESPLCAAIMNVQHAMSAIEQHIKTLGFHAPAAEEPPMAHEPPPAGPPMGGSPFAAAASGLHNDMMAAAAKRKQPQLP